MITNFDGLKRAFDKFKSNEAHSTLRHQKSF